MFGLFSKKNDEAADKKNNATDEEPNFTFFYEGTGYRATEHKKQPNPPNWVEKLGVFVLLFTLAAAIWAALEADRLATDTEAATEHSDRIANSSADQTATLYAAWGQFAAAMNRQAANTGGLVEQAKRSARYAGVSAGAAKESAAAGLGQLNEMRNEQRPIVTVSYLAVDVRPDGFWRVAPHIENTGNTPVRDLQYEPVTSTGPVFEGSTLHTDRYGMLLGGNTRYWQGADDPDSMFGILGAPFRFPLGPKSAHPDFDSPGYESPANLTDIGPGKRCRRILTGAIHYGDFLNETAKHVTKYCFILSGAPDETGKLKPAYQACPFWNCTDQECKQDKASYYAQAPEAKKLAASQPQPWKGTKYGPCSYPGK